MQDATAATLDSRHEGQLRFSPDGKGIVYPVREKGVDNLWLQPLDGGPSRELTNFTSLKIYSYQWSPDGKSLALVAEIHLLIWC
jgi:Tol biopolymer transport system component